MPSLCSTVAMASSSFPNKSCDVPTTSMQTFVQALSRSGGALVTGALLSGAFDF